eukprot:CAMPEP_0196585600 /NCGR_PEP_ID=MMETSP1081-20130531/51293_1 /TAXON_ID=36882 /ORGANISM="Pyramimonas amylifera, Strain CCMP720" /LENGTH=143 /DNA_ID=CAMNT_0041907205 /DNA_START=166 /DNA_END=594 /DNA_ORIENTATION=+
MALEVEKSNLTRELQQLKDSFANVSGRQFQLLDQANQMCASWCSPQSPGLPPHPSLSKREDSLPNSIHKSQRNSKPFFSSSLPSSISTESPGLNYSSIESQQSDSHRKVFNECIAPQTPQTPALHGIANLQGCEESVMTTESE